MTRSRSTSSEALRFEASPAFRIATEVRQSSLRNAGRGVFTLENVVAGTFLGMDFPNPARIASEAEVLALPVEQRMYSWRQIEHVCFAANPDERVAADLMNHSFEPNVHWHVGHYFALDDMAVGDELLLDYRHLLSPHWNDRLQDAATGRPVNGWEWREALVASCQTMIDLMERTDSDED